MRVEKIGNCALYCGDWHDAMPSTGKIGAIVSDPPYGIGYQHGGGGGNGIRLQSEHTYKGVIVGDSAPFDPSDLLRIAPESRNAKGEAIGSRIVLWGADHFRARLPEYGTLLAWDKHLGFAPNDSFVDCEWAWCGRPVKREVFRYLWKGCLARNKSNPLDERTRQHVSQKPVELMRWCIDKARPINGLPVFDPYMGSGSTGVACVTLGLPFVGVEIVPGIFETACRRIRDAYKAVGEDLFEEQVNA